MESPRRFELTLEVISRQEPDENDLDNSRSWIKTSSDTSLSLRYSLSLSVSLLFTEHRKKIRVYLKYLGT